MPIPVSPEVQVGVALPDELTVPAGLSVSAFTMRWYASLPECLRQPDPDLGYPLLRLLSLLGDLADGYERVLDAMPGRLVDPARADAAWLPWLGQLLGVRLPGGLGEQASRDAVAGAASGWRAGTRESIAAAAASALTGTRYVAVYDHTTPTSGIGAGGVWDVLLVTRPDETPDPAAVVQAVLDAGAKPAGVVLWHTSYRATWAQVEAAYPTWAGRNGLTWDELHLTGL